MSVSEAGLETKKILTVSRGTSTRSSAPCCFTITTEVLILSSFNTGGKEKKEK